MRKLIIKAKLPGLNEYIEAERGSKYKAAKLKHEAESVIIWTAKQQLRGYKPVYPVFMRYTWIEQNRKRDKDNIAFAKKFIQDALRLAGILKNDGWAEIAGFSDDFQVDPKGYAVIVEIYDRGEY